MGDGAYDFEFNQMAMIISSGSTGRKCNFVSFKKKIQKKISSLLSLVFLKNILLSVSITV